MNLDRALKAAAEHYTHGRFVDALRIYERLLQESPDHPDALNDAGLCHYQLGALQEAIACFEQALEHDPSYEGAFFNLLEVTLNTEDRKQAATRFETFGTAIPQSPEKERFDKQIHAPHPQHRGDGAPAFSHNTDTLRVAFVCGPDRKFITDIEREIGKRHEVRTAHFDDAVNVRRIQQAMDWADVTWFERCSKILAHAGQKLKKTSRVVCRLHGYEVFTDLPGQVKWSFVDHLLFVADHKKEIFEQRFPNVRVRKSVIRNGVDLDAFSIPSEKVNNKHLLLMGNLNYHKGLPMLLQFYYELLKKDPDFHLTIRGQWQDPRYRVAASTMIDELGLDDKITFVEQWIDDLNSWLADKSHILSFSLEESFHYAVGDAMAAGLKPVVHAWRESRSIWPEKHIFRNVSEFTDLCLAPSYTPARYREHVAIHCPLSDKIDAIDDTLKNIVTAGSPDATQGSTVNRAQISWSDAAKNKRHIFVAIPNRCGSTLMARFLDTSPASTTLGTSYHMDNEGAQIVMRETPSAMPHPRGRKRIQWAFEALEEFQSKRNYDWDTIKSLWYRNWDLEKKILVEKSTQNVARIKLLEREFPNTFFVLGIRSPYAACRSMMKQMGYSPTETAKHWLTCAKLQIRNMDEISSPYVFATYERLTSSPDSVANAILSHIPELDRFAFGEKMEISNCNRDQRMDSVMMR